jgi:putative PIN family toxin of toxin-antitoxin system
VRAVIDTNVLVSAIWSADGPPAAIIERMLSGDVEPVFDDRMMDEYCEVLTRSKFSFDEKRVGALLNAIKLLGIHIDPAPCEEDLPDEGDRAFWECAVSANTPLVTGNTRHFPGSNKVVTPAEFIKMLNASG